ncbi:hypothetical protein PRIPAC_84039 [Pristionchus pacificus]|uniref:Uncharacterized protein n=1 Tax=Pristionchus pacificus TaxID=54126 RepID=A0A2A6BNJ1_PRIPA|nr:hypothetical protein PRIPAC_84039 [Pristionchus pacificus]|eukprot:PDM67532.1 hypothetical protein PRIPAC_48949 [Pristionchus pacificus]
MNSFLLFVLLSSIAVVIHSKGQGRAAGYPPSIRGFPVPVKDEYMAIIAMKDTEEKYKKMKEWGVKNGKDAQVIVDDFFKKMERNKKKEEKKNNEPKKDPKKETKKDPKKDSKKA